jgi:hypothetical protein
MKMQDLFVVTLAILLAAGVSLSQQSAATSQPPAATTPAAEESASGSPQEQAVTEIVALKYYPANEMSSLLASLSQGEATIVPDQRWNQLIITAPARRIEELLHVIAALDVANVSVPQSQYLTCRVYMLEVPAKDQNLRSFSVLLERSSQVPPGQVLDAAKEANAQISTLLQRTEDDKWSLIIEGRTASNDALKQMLAKIPDSQVRQLKWDDEGSAAAIPAAQLSRLPSPLQDHIRKFLGDEVQTVGYWFGNLSVPGNVKASIGPWLMEMKTQSEQGADLVLEVRVSRESPIPFVPETQLLSNTIQGKVGRPVIIGYNRDAYGTRVMGAMVVLLEADTTAAPAGEAQTK